MVITTGTTIFDGEKKEYTVKEFINRGGYGSVFSIEDTNNNIFALKTLPEAYSDESVLKGLSNDFENAIKIEGENVLKQLYFHDGGTYEELPPYIIMEYANGGTLRDYIENENLGLEEKLTIMSQIVKGMKSINNILIHRDLKPENILINDNLVKISDFGLSKLAEDVTRTKSFKGLGTPLYMSPEAWRYEANTILMDIYSIGIIFYELLTGKYPFDYDPSDPDSLEKIHLYTNIEPISNNFSDIPLNLSQLVVKMTKKNPKQRIQTWDAVEELLNHKDNKESKYGNLIKTIASGKEATDSEEEKRRLEEEAKRREQNDYEERIHFIIKDEVVSLYEEFLNELKDEVHEEYSINERSPLEYSVNIFSKGTIDITFQILKDDNFVREVHSPFDRDERGVMKVVRPEYQKELILAWGVIKTPQGFGFNLFLCGDLKDSNYKWYMTQSTNSAAVRRGSHTKQAEPFAFDFNELEKEVKLFNAMHAYNTTKKDFDIEFFAELVNFVLTGKGFDN